MRREGVVTEIWSLRPEGVVVFLWGKLKTVSVVVCRVLGESGEHVDPEGSSTVEKARESFSRVGKDS